MVQHGRCLRLLKFICDILFGCPVDALRQLAALDTIIDEHHTLFVQLYGGHLATPKLHWLFHVVEMIHKSGCFNCFKAERDHGKIHEAGELCRRGDHKRYEQYVLKRSLWQLFQALPDMSFCADELLGSHINQISKQKQVTYKNAIMIIACGQAIASRGDDHHADSPRCDGLPTSKGVSMKI